MSMPPEPVTGFCIFPRVGDDLQDGRADGVAVAAVGLGELAERGGVEVEPLDGDPHLVGPDRGVGVEAPGRLRQDAGRLEHPVHPEGSFGRSTHVSLPLTGSIQKNLARSPISPKILP